ncbi:MAG: hypothetical protein WCR49_10740, partial [Opitutae bacterium]
MNARNSEVFQFKSPMASFVYFRSTGKERMSALIEIEQASPLTFQAELLLNWIDLVDISQVHNFVCSKDFFWNF